LHAVEEQVIGRFTFSSRRLLQPIFGWLGVVGALISARMVLNACVTHSRRVTPADRVPKHFDGPARFNAHRLAAEVASGSVDR
jgi:hypothetical protein